MRQSGMTLKAEFNSMRAEIAALKTQMGKLNIRPFAIRVINDPTDF
jgi:hypothetical protein